MDIENVSFEPDALFLLKEIADLFSENRDLIVENWMKSHTPDLAKFGFLEQGIRILVDDFIKYLSKPDLHGYLRSNLSVAKLIIAHDIPYGVFIDAFHDFEESYLSILDKKYGKDILKPLEVIDKLHHKTISLLAEEYFRVKDATIFALAKLAEYKDFETGAHLERTKEYSKIIAEALGCNQEFIDNIYTVSSLHDIGKVGIPDKVLLKPGSLTSEEFEIMKLHTKIGGDTLNAIIGDLEIIRGNLLMGRDIAYDHHEKFDGSGYAGLTGKNIPLSARVFTIADIYDALISKRCYKKALTHQDAVYIITRGDGRTKPEHFDPEVLEIFKKSVQLFFEVSQQYKD